MRTLLTSYRKQTALIPHDVCVRVYDYFGLEPTHHLRGSLERAGLCQADLVLCLLRVNTRRSLRCAEIVVGRRIEHCPPCLRLSPPMRELVIRRGDERRVLSMAPSFTRIGGGRCLESAPMYDRLRLVRAGLTVAQLLSRGLRRKDIRVAERRQWLRLEPEVAA